MTVPEQRPRTLFTGDGVTTRFLLPYKLIEKQSQQSFGVDWLDVYIEPPQTDEHPIFGTVDGAVLQRHGRDYTFDRDTYYITMTTPVPTGHVLVLNRNTPADQETDYQTTRPFLLDGAIEYPWDKITHRIQELVEMSRRLMKRRVSDPGFPPIGKVGSYRLCRITADLGNGSYIVREVKADDPFDNDHPDLSGGYVGQAEEFNLCNLVVVGSLAILYVLPDDHGGSAYRFRNPGCIQVPGSSSASSSGARYVIEYIACDGSGDKLYFDPAVQGLGQVIWVPN